MSQGFINSQTIPLPVNVSSGGTGNGSATAYAVICGGTTSTSNLQSIAGVGTSGQVLKSNGAGSLPTFQNETGGNGSVGAWVNFNGTGTVAIRDSSNISSITDNGVGLYTLNFTSGLPNANYSASGTTGYTPALEGSIVLYYQNTAMTTTAFPIGVGVPGTSGGTSLSPRDLAYVFVQIID